MRDHLVEFESHSERVDLSKSATEIERQLLPEPTYYNKVWERFPDVHPFDIQRNIIRNWKKGYHEKSDYGEYWYQHVIRFMKMLMPKTVITPWIMDEAWALQLTLSKRRDIINYIGSKSSGKSAFMARIAITLVAADPDNTICYAAAPYKNAADYTIWGEIENCFKESMDRHGEVFPGARFVSSTNKAIFSDKNSKSGRIELVGLDRVARLQGAKSQNSLQGFLILIADEVAVFQSQAFIEIIANITANLNFIGFTGCNFKDSMGMEGLICSPQGAEYTELREDEDQVWLSDYNSVTMRLDGHRCPNVTQNRVIYPFLLTEEKRQVMEDIHGKKGPKYLEQVRSFPNMASTENFILTMEQLRSGGAFDDFWDKTGLWQRVAFCDPGWQGDPCKIGGFEFGPARVQTHDGSMQDTFLFKSIGPIEQIKVEVNKIADVDYMRRLEGHSDSPIMMREGREVTMDNQIALQCAEFLSRHNIPHRSFGFDASCRGSITQEMMTIVGRECTAYDFGGRPTAFPVDGSGTLAMDKYRNLRTEMYFLVQLVVLAGQLRGAELIMDALAQICRHRYNTLGAKVAVEPKEEYKKCNQQKSPDAADVLVGALHVARKQGLPLSFTRGGKNRPLSANLEELSSLRPRPKVPRLTSHFH